MDINERQSLMVNLYVIYSHCDRLLKQCCGLCRNHQRLCLLLPSQHRHCICDGGGDQSDQLATRRAILVETVSSTLRSLSID